MLRDLFRTTVETEAMLGVGLFGSAVIEGSGGSRCRPHFQEVSSFKERTLVV